MGSFLLCLSRPAGNPDDESPTSLQNFHHGALPVRHARRSSMQAALKKETPRSDTSCSILRHDHLGLNRQRCAVPHPFEKCVISNCITPSGDVRPSTYCIGYAEVQHKQRNRPFAQLLTDDQRLLEGPLHTPCCMYSTSVGCLSYL